MKSVINQFKTLHIISLYLYQHCEILFFIFNNYHLTDNQPKKIIFKKYLIIKYTIKENSSLIYKFNLIDLFSSQSCQPVMIYTQEILIVKIVNL